MQRIYQLIARIRHTLRPRTEPVEELTLPEPAGRLWGKVHESVNKNFGGQGGFRLGGGTLLAARWKHRVSVDIDLTIQPKGRRPPEIANLIREGSSFRKEVERLGCGEPSAPSGHQIRIPFHESTLDISVLDAYPGAGEHIARVNGKGAVVLSTTQVLGGKLARPEQLLHRDAYDIRHAGQVDKQSLAKAVNGINRSEAEKILRTWKKLDGRWAAMAPGQLRTVVPKHSYEPATLAAETAEALRDALYQRVRIMTHGRKGTFYAETVGRTAVQVSFTRGTLMETLRQHGIEDYVRHQSTDPDNVEILERIRKACRFGAKPQTVYETTHKTPTLETSQPPTKRSAVGATPPHPVVSVPGKRTKTAAHKRDRGNGRTR